MLWAGCISTLCDSGATRVQVEDISHDNVCSSSRLSRQGIGVKERENDAEVLSIMPSEDA